MEVRCSSPAAAAAQPSSSAAAARAATVGAPVVMAPREALADRVVSGRVVQRRPAAREARRAALTRRRGLQELLARAARAGARPTWPAVAAVVVAAATSVV